MPYRQRPFLLAAFALALLIAGCEQVEEIRHRISHASPHEAYAASLADAGLDDTALGRAWERAGQDVLDEATSIDLPFREARYLDPAVPAAIGYRFEVQRGQQLIIEVNTQVADSSEVFIDLFSAPRDSADAPRHRRSADSTGILSYAIQTTGAYLLRVQPELLRGGRFTITIQTDASLAFPVSGVDSGAIRSRFGAPRDGGRRQHHGVDIFAARGTPALAAADAVVLRVRTGGLGGKTVWLRDAAGHSLYYAHLDSQMVRPGMRVSVGDTVGLVGNTGNARTTPPHLHFGIYRDGPTDPYPFIHKPRERPSDVRVDTSRLGRWTRAARPSLTLRAMPDRRADALHDVPLHTALFVDGGSGGWYRVRLPDGTTGYLDASLLEPAGAPLRELRLAAGRPVRNQPSSEALAIDSLTADAAVPVLARFEAYLYVEAPSGRTGWIASD